MFENLTNEPVQWQKYAWIIERTFNEWNIRHKIDHTSKGDRLSSLVAGIQKQNQPLVNNETNQGSQRIDNGDGVDGEVEEKGLETEESILDQG